MDVLVYVDIVKWMMAKGKCSQCVLIAVSVWRIRNEPKNERQRVDGTESGKHSMSKKYCRKAHHRCALLDSILAKMKSKPNQMASKWKNVRKNWQIYWKQIKAIKSEQNFNQTSSKIIHNGFSNVAHKNAYILCMWLFWSIASVAYVHVCMSCVSEWVLLCFRFAIILYRCVVDPYILCRIWREKVRCWETIIFIYIPFEKTIMAIHWISHISVISAQHIFMIMLVCTITVKHNKIHTFQPNARIINIYAFEMRMGCLYYSFA